MQKAGMPTPQLLNERVLDQRAPFVRREPRLMSVNAMFHQLTIQVLANFLTFMEGRRERGVENALPSSSTLAGGAALRTARPENGVDAVRARARPARHWRRRRIRTLLPVMAAASSVVIPCGI
jgi:hypothetical protein